MSNTQIRSERGFTPPQGRGTRPPVGSPLHTSASWRDENHTMQMQQHAGPPDRKSDFADVADKIGAFA